MTTTDRNVKIILQHLLFLPLWILFCALAKLKQCPENKITPWQIKFPGGERQQFAYTRI